MQTRRTLIAGLAAAMLSGCSFNWAVDYEAPVSAEVARGWRLGEVVVRMPEGVTTSDNNTFAPRADIVWHGEPYGDRKEQVAALFSEAITRATGELAGPRPVTFVVEVEKFHGVTPVAVARAPAAVHSIAYRMGVIDFRTGEVIVAPRPIRADLDAYVGPAAVAAAIEGQTQRVRVVDHLEAVTRGWLGLGPDPRRTFRGIGR